MNILIIEDNTFLAQNIRKSFLKYSFSHRIEILHSYSDFLFFYSYISTFDIILLDINLSNNNQESGLVILSHIREKYQQIPIIMISSYSDYSIMSEAFSRGAHDYIIKPFRTRELQIRIERWFRNYILSEYYSLSHSLEYKELIYDISAYRFFYKGNEILLTPGNKYIFSLFVIHKEKILSQNFLSEKIWGYGEDMHKKNMRIKIMRLNKQLENGGLLRSIITMKGGGGYMFRL